MVIVHVHLRDDGSYRFELQGGDPGPDITKELVAIAMAHQSKCFRVPAIDPNNGAAISYLGGMSVPANNADAVRDALRNTGRYEIM